MVESKPRMSRVPDRDLKLKRGHILVALVLALSLVVISGTSLVYALSAAQTGSMANQPLLQPMSFHVLRHSVNGVFSSGSEGTSTHSFTTANNVYAVVTQTGTGGSSSAFRLYVVDSPCCTDGQTLSDKSGGYETSSGISHDTTFPVWSAPTTAGTYYVVLDSNVGGTYGTFDSAFDYVDPTAFSIVGVTTGTTTVSVTATLYSPTATLTSTTYSPTNTLTSTESTTITTTTSTSTTATSTEVSTFSASMTETSSTSTTTTSFIPTTELSTSTTITSTTSTSSTATSTTKTSTSLSQTTTSTTTTSTSTSTPLTTASVTQVITSIETSSSEVTVVTIATVTSTSVSGRTMVSVGTVTSASYKTITRIVSTTATAGLMPILPAPENWSSQTWASILSAVLFGGLVFTSWDVFRRRGQTSVLHTRT